MTEPTKQEKIIQTIEPIIKTLEYIKARAEAGYDDNPIVITLATPHVESLANSARGTFAIVGNGGAALSMLNDALFAANKELVMQNAIALTQILEEHSDDKDDDF